jgi:hypothetical protein
MEACGTTHYEGCECHEEGWRKRLAETLDDNAKLRHELKMLLGTEGYRLEKWQNLIAEVTRLRAALERLMQREWESSGDSEEYHLARAALGLE